MKYFVFSDVHGDYEALRDALEEAKYNPQSRDNVLLSLGDNFGRADLSPESTESLKIYEYLISSEHTNAPICLYGNHEDIFYKMLKRGTITATDVQNGEVKTLASFSGLTEMGAYVFAEGCCSRIRRLPVYSWLKSLPFYYETPNYIFMHGWLPNRDGWTGNFRRASRKIWVGASWAHTEREIEKFVSRYPKGMKKILVFGHWGTYRLREHFPDGGVGHDIWHNEKSKLIGLDTTTVLSHRVNVLRIED